MSFPSVPSPRWAPATILSTRSAVVLKRAIAAPFLTADAADHLAEAGAALVGIDSYNIDDTADGRRPAHSTLLARGIPIVEHLCGLGDLPDQGFKFFAVPVKVKSFGTFPVRAFGLVPKHRAA
jgi:kynurenine formamidase